MSKGIFRNKNFVLVFFGALVSNIGAMLYSFAVSYYILEITENDGFLQGLYLALTGVTFVVVSLYGGILSDRLNRAKIMYTCDYIKGGLILLSTLVLFLDERAVVHVVVLFALGILGNAVSAIFSPASSSILPFIVEEEKLQQANSCFSILSSFQAIVGVVLAGILYVAMSVRTLFLLVGACYLLSGLSEMFIRYDYRRPEGTMTIKSALTDMKEGFVYLSKEKAILAIMLSMLFINFFCTPIFENFFPYFIATEVKGGGHYLFDQWIEPELWNSITTVCFGGGSLVAGFLIGAQKPREKCSGIVKICLSGMSVILFGLSLVYLFAVERGDNVSAFLIAMSIGLIFIGALIVFINVPISTTIQRVVDRRLLGKVNSVLTATSQGLIPIACFLAGIVLSTWGCMPMLFLCSIGFLVTTVSLVFNREVRSI